MSGDGQGHLRVAIIGSGPAGYYTAEALTKGRDDVSVDVIDRLPSPYGLIRGGVAPDHQSIKGVDRRYQKTALQTNVRFVGNLSIGDDVTVKELANLYDAVVIATGAPHDRRLSIPGADKKNVLGSAEFVGWYNSHPDFADLAPDLKIDTVAIIGNGNVAIDAARVLAKTPAEMAESDIAAYAETAIDAAPIKDIWMFGRRGPIDAKFTPKELGELGRLERCVTITKPGQIPDDVGALEGKEATVKRKNLAHLQAFADCAAGEKPVRLHLEFYAQPVEVLGDGRVEGLRLERTRVEDGGAVGTGEMFDVPCQMIISCIGYRSAPLDAVPFDERTGHFLNENGLIMPGLYAVGWARRGPTGTIGTNRPDGIAIAEKILAAHSTFEKEGRAGLDRLITERNLEIVTFRDWQNIDKAEIDSAAGLAPRAKFAHIEEMMDVVRAAKR